MKTPRFAATMIGWGTKYLAISATLRAEHVNWESLGDVLVPPDKQDEYTTAIEDVETSNDRADTEATEQYKQEVQEESDKFMRKAQAVTDLWEREAQAAADSYNAAHDQACIAVGPGKESAEQYNHAIAVSEKKYNAEMKAADSRRRERMVALDPDLARLDEHCKAPALKLKRVQQESKAEALAEKLKVLLKYSNV